MSVVAGFQIPEGGPTLQFLQFQVLPTSQTQAEQPQITTTTTVELLGKVPAIPLRRTTKLCEACISQVSDPRWSETAWAKKMKAKAGSFGCVWEAEFDEAAKGSGSISALTVLLQSSRARGPIVRCLIKQVYAYVNASRGATRSLDLPNRRAREAF